ncbi:hypothetical protein [Paenibacillus sp. Marseille-Q4541]|uniref:hypothetical protein n=1 Tax=Paenibacillus sp. Marseille-Q4541 TaxID=2831522 RepID=UPI001BAC35F6|nr:hypothetical protein [Paenibacillus sp. Marseille-Q4541]
MGKYLIKVDSVQKKVNIEVTGKFSYEEGNNFVSEFRTKTSNMITSSYDFECKCIGLNIADAESLPSLEAAFSEYKQCEFKSYKMIVEPDKKSKTLTTSAGLVKSQLGRLSRKSGLPDMEIIVVD